MLALCTHQVLDCVKCHWCFAMQNWQATTCLHIVLHQHIESLKDGTCLAGRSETGWLVLLLGIACCTDGLCGVHLAAGQTAQGIKVC